jgi:CubicO group peptidase (beta-lactamase class C family)
MGSYGTLTNSETRMNMASDRLRFVLERPVVASPGTRFTYNGGATALLGELVARRTGVSLAQFARETLFAPLGINDVEWRSDSKGKTHSWSGLRLRPRDLAKIGRLMLDDGRWGDRQVVPADWVRESLRGRVSADAGTTYGYQWWSGKLRWRGGVLPWNAGLGNGGQRLYLVPSLDLVVVVTAGRYNEPTGGRASGLLFDGVMRAFTAPAPQ